MLKTDKASEIHFPWPAIKFSKEAHRDVNSKNM